MSNETKWTPGEWRVNPKAKTHVECDDHGIASTGSWAARSMDSLDIEVEQRANAHLIAAAPELYEALEGLYKLLMHPSLDTDETIPELVEAEAAMAKARGES